MNQKTDGFTLFETIVVVAILTLVGGVSLISFVNSRRVRDLATAGQDALSVLRLAQTKAVAGDGASPWGVRLEPAQFVLFRGATFAEATLIDSYPLPSTVEIANIALTGGGQEVVFRRLDGRAASNGTFDVRVQGSANQIFSITIDPSGRAYQTGTAPVTTGTRVADARHRNFTLGWSIRDTITMTLTFSDSPAADVVYPVVMTPLPPRMSFDWSGTVAVGGQNQSIRIHALSITDTNTILSVDRDCRRNTKKVNIAIDAQDIAAYEADCATVTVGVFGGTMNEP